MGYEGPRLRQPDFDAADAVDRRSGKFCGSNEEIPKGERGNSRGRTGKFWRANQETKLRRTQKFVRGERRNFYRPRLRPRDRQDNHPQDTPEPRPQGARPQGTSPGPLAPSAPPLDAPRTRPQGACPQDTSPETLRPPHRPRTRPGHASRAPASGHLPGAPAPAPSEPRQDAPRTRPQGASACSGGPPASTCLARALALTRRRRKKTRKEPGHMSPMGPMSGSRARGCAPARATNAAFEPKRLRRDDGDSTSRAQSKRPSTQARGGPWPKMPPRGFGGHLGPWPSGPLDPQPRHVAFWSRGHIGDLQPRHVALWRTY